MARPVKHGLRYFPFDVNLFDDHKLLMIEEDLGVKGGYLAVRLMAMVYEQGYYLEWNDNSKLSCAKRVGNGFTGALVCEILNSCLIHGLFDKKIFDEFAILTSYGIQQRWMEVMKQLRRKVEVNVSYWVVSSEETPDLPEETTSPETFGTQKERKGKETKKQPCAPAPPSPPKKIANKKQDEDPPEEFWQPLVDEYFRFYAKNFPGEEPSFAGRDPKLFKDLIHRLKKRASKKNLEWTEANAVSTLKFFLDLAISEDWLRRHFLLKNIVEQFDSVYQRAQDAINDKNGKKKQVVTHETTPKLSNELNFLIDRFREGNFDDRAITPEIYSRMERTGVVPEGYLQKFPGHNLDEKSVAAVKSWLKLQTAAA